MFKRTALLSVPSGILNEEDNVLINQYTRTRAHHGVQGRRFIDDRLA